jgi:hypothetical protein
MITVETVREMALSFPGTEEKEHWGKPSFRVKNKIYSTLWISENQAMARLSLLDQSVFCSMDSIAFFPVPGGWGKQGATFVNLKKVRKDMFKDALKTAYAEVTKKKKQRRRSNGL